MADILSKLGGVGDTLKNVADVNKDGKVDMDDLKAAIGSDKKDGKDANGGIGAKLTSALDANGDGKLGLDDAKAAIGKIGDLFGKK